MVTVYLNRMLAVPWDLNEYYKKYDVKDKYQLLQGAPVLINVEGTYVELESLIYAAKAKDRKLISMFISSIRHPFNKGTPCLMPVIKFKWNRNP